MTKKIIISLLSVALILGLMAPNTFAQDQLPGPQTAFEVPFCIGGQQLAIKVKWGNVFDQPQDTTQMSFDGRLWARGGNVYLIKPLRFEKHDQITSTQDPISWQSWTYGGWDGLEIRTSICTGLKLVLETEQGGLTLPLRRLMQAKKPIVFQLDDGREIVVKSLGAVIPQPSFLINARWGDPIVPETSEPTCLLPTNAVDNTGSTILTHEQTVCLPPLSQYAYPPIDFSGSMTVHNGARIKFQRADEFEKNQGDKIIGHGKYYVNWRSTITRYYDSIDFEVFMDMTGPYDDTAIFNFPNIGQRFEVPLAKLYKGEFVDYAFKLNSVIYRLRLHKVDPQVGPPPIPLPISEVELNQVTGETPVDGLPASLEPESQITAQEVEDDAEDVADIDEVTTEDVDPTLAPQSSDETEETEDSEDAESTDSDPTAQMLLDADPQPMEVMEDVQLDMGSGSSGGGADPIMDSEEPFNEEKPDSDSQSVVMGLVSM